MSSLQASISVELQETPALRTYPNHAYTMESLPIGAIEESQSRISQAALAGESSARAWLSVLGAFLFLFPSYGRLTNRRSLM